MVLNFLDFITLSILEMKSHRLLGVRAEEMGRLATESTLFCVPPIMLSEVKARGWKFCVRILVQGLNRKDTIWNNQMSPLNG